MSDVVKFMYDFVILAQANNGWSQMKTQKERQLLIASVLIDMGMDDGLIEVVTNLKQKEFQHLKK